MNSAHDVDKASVSNKAVERRSRSIFYPLPNDKQQSERNDRKEDDYDTFDVKVHSAEAAEIPAAEKQQIGRIENLSGKKESIIPESTKELESESQTTFFIAVQK